MTMQQPTLANPMRREVTVFSCGGAATNIVSGLEKDSAPGFAKMNACYIDTSRSNFIGKKNISEESVYLFEGMDGSGKVRAANYEEIAKSCKSILHKFKPTDFNIIVHSCSGGTGSTVAPVLAAEMMARGLNFVVIAIGSTDTRIEIENTIKTLKSYESIAVRRERPVIMHYVENSQSTPRAKANIKVQAAISFLMGLFSGQNSELDTADLKNWLNYIPHSQTEPRLCSLNFASKPEELEDIGTVVSVATLAADNMDTRVTPRPAYQCVGYVPEEWKKGSQNSIQMVGEHPIHYCISEDFIIDSVNSLNRALKEVDELFGSRNARNVIVDRNDNSTDLGIVL